MSNLQPTSFTEVGRIHRSLLGSGKCSLVVTCAKGAEGTSLLSFLLAQRSVESGKKTLLVDTNMKNTWASDELNLERTPWELSNTTKELKIAAKATQVAGSKNFWVLPAPKDEASILWLKETKNAEKFIKALEKDFDHVIVDTTPIGALNRQNVDPVVLASVAKRATLVVLSGTTDADKARTATRQLQEAGADLKGVVLNDAEKPAPKDQLLDMAARFSKISPGFGSWLKNKVSRLEI